MSMKKPTIELYDTTLRDGQQGEDVLFSVEDKIRICERLAEMGIAVIEGGWPGASPKDDAFFQQAKSLTLKKSRLAAFGSTRRAGSTPEKDTVIQGLLKAETPVITIFGKTWDLHVRDALGISLEENLELIDDSIRYLKQRVDTVYFDAEHFFDGFKGNPEYARKVLQTARGAGADALVLCDTNGGSLVSDVTDIMEEVSDVGGPFGIHCHNDSGLAVANTLAAVEAGAAQVQGTVNGIGERCGNANLISVIPNLRLKMGRDVGLDAKQMAKLTGLSRFVDEMTNRRPRKNQPFVGRSAFAHKGGIHVSAVLKNAETYEHIQPETVGNRQRVLVSDQSGKSNLQYKFQELGLQWLYGKGTAIGKLLAKAEKHEEEAGTRKLLKIIKEMEHQGYQYDGAEASFEILARKALGKIPEYFTLRGFRVIDERRKNKEGETELLISDASVKVEVGGQLEHTAAEGNGPVNALDTALRKALERFYPQLGELELVDFKVRILSSVGGTGAAVRVFVETSDGKTRWGTVGVSENIIAAAYQALVDAVTYKLLKDEVRAPKEIP